MSRIIIVGAAVAGLLGLVAAAAFFGRSTIFDNSSSKNTAPPARAPRVYREKLDGSKYVNQDLGLAIAAPEKWTPSIGKRSDELPSYEGLVLKIESRGDPDPETQVRPIVSVFKKTLPPGPPRDAVGYIRANLISPPKKVTEAPMLTAVAGRSVASVSYEMPVAK